MQVPLMAPFLNPVFDDQTFGQLLWGGLGLTVFTGSPWFIDIGWGLCFIDIGINVFKKVRRYRQHV